MLARKYFRSEHPHEVIPSRLARKVYGLAHVLIEPWNRFFSLKLRDKTNSKNPYSGAIGIYWPQGQRISYYHCDGKTAKEIEDYLFDDIMKNSAATASIIISGLDEVQNRIIGNSTNILKTKIKHTRELMGGEYEKLEKDEKIDELLCKINLLEQQIRTLQSQSSMHGCINLNAGDETDFYNDEIKNIILESLEKSIINTKENSRRNHILSSLLANNKKSQEMTIRKERLKKALTGYRSMDKSTARMLKQLGFELSEEGKHWKVTYNGDSRYVYILPKTGSDHRGALNAISDINNMIF